MTHYILAIVAGIVIGLYLVFRIVTMRVWRFEVAAAGNLILTYLLTGYFLFPALAGGLLTREYSQQGNQPLSMGVSVMVIAAVGLLVTDRKRMAGFLLSVLLFVLSLEMFKPVFRLMPYKALQNSYWYQLVAVGFFLVTLLCWERLRLLFLILFFGIIIGESAPQFATLQNGNVIIAESEQTIKDYLLDKAAAMTDNRLALMDNAALGDLPYWYLAAQGVNTLAGWDFDNALTVRNQAHINEAFADGFYEYIFDRLLLYGNDVIVIQKELFTEEGAYEVMLHTAAENGYQVGAENDKAVVLKADGIKGSFGVVSEYTNLAIGENASGIAYIYPSFGLGRSDCLEDYTVDELETYQRIYLSGFTYREKEKAENMLRELAEKGVQIYIDMQHIPINVLTGKNEFMGIYAQFVQFTEDFPILENDNGNQFKLDFKTQGYETWNTVYVSGCKEVLKETVYDGNKHLAYMGRNQDKNITFMGFNLVYYYLSTHNKDLKRFLDEAMLLSNEPDRNPVIVPLAVERQPMKLIVHSQADGVNSNIANIDTLFPDRIIYSEENMWVVNCGDTVFTLMRPKQLEGICCSVLGGICVGLLWIMVYVVLEIPTREKGKTEALS